MSGRCEHSGSHKMREVSWLAEVPLASQDGIHSIIATFSFEDVLFERVSHNKPAQCTDI